VGLKIRAKTKKTMNLEEFNSKFATPFEIITIIMVASNLDIPQKKST
jgi:hypothetical protein